MQLPAVVIAVGWLAAAGQVAALAAGRYAPYPERRANGPRAGPCEKQFRRVVLTVRDTRKRTPESERKALEA